MRHWFFPTHIQLTRIHSCRRFCEPMNRVLSASFVFFIIQTYSFSHIPIDTWIRVYKKKWKICTSNKWNDSTWWFLTINTPDPERKRARRTFTTGNRFNFIAFVFSHRKFLLRPPIKIKINVKNIFLVFYSVLATMIPATSALKFRVFKLTCRNPYRCKDWSDRNVF